MIRSALLYAAGAYAADVLWTPERVARQARAAAGSKPVLNVGCGTGSSSLRAFLFGPTRWGDVNCDIAARRNCSTGYRRPCHCDAMNLPFPDKMFGAVIASHVLEHVSDPERAMAEFTRVADLSFVIVPKWWAPHTWLHPGHRFFIDQDGGLKPLWGGSAQ